MQTIPFLPNHQRFNSEVVRSMSVAYANVCRALGLSTKPDPATEVVALKIMEIAERGARTADDNVFARRRGIQGRQIGGLFLAAAGLLPALTNLNVHHEGRGNRQIYECGVIPSTCPVPTWPVSRRDCFFQALSIVERLHRNSPDVPIEFAGPPARVRFLIRQAHQLTWEPWSGILRRYSGSLVQCARWSDELEINGPRRHVITDK